MKYDEVIFWSSSFVSWNERTLLSDVACTFVVGTSGTSVPTRHFTCPIKHEVFIWYDCDCILCFLIFYRSHMSHRCSPCLTYTWHCTGVLDLMTHCIIEPPQGLDVRAFIKREKTPISGLRSSSGDDDVDADARGNNAQHLPASFSHEQGPPAPPPVPPPMPVGGHDTHDPSNRALSSMLGLLTRRTDSDNSYASHSSANAHGGMEQLSMPEPPSPATMLRKGKGPSAYQITSPRGFPVFEFVRATECCCLLCQVLCASLCHCIFLKFICISSLVSQLYVKQMLLPFVSNFYVQHRQRYCVLTQWSRCGMIVFLMSWLLVFRLWSPREWARWMEISGERIPCNSAVADQ